MAVGGRWCNQSVKLLRAYYICARVVERTFTCTMEWDETSACVDPSIGMSLARVYFGF
jgi:hypothetical protein